MKKYLFTAVLLLLSGTAFANSYQVEMVVFEYLTPDSGGETWNTGNAPDYRNTINLQAGTAVSGGFKILPSSSYKLGGVDRVLKLSSEYRPIYHIAWQQPELTKSRAKKVRIKSPEAKLNGSVNLRGGHLLHLDLDISYFIDLYTENSASVIDINAIDQGLKEEVEMSGTYAQMKETRRIKLNELHYFDHPLFGILMRVTRI